MYFVIIAPPISRFLHILRINIICMWWLEVSWVRWSTEVGNEEWGAVLRDHRDATSLHSQTLQGPLQHRLLILIVSTCQAGPASGRPIPSRLTALQRI